MSVLSKRKIPQDSSLTVVTPGWQLSVPILLGMVFGFCTYASYNNGQIQLSEPKLYISAMTFIALFLILFSAIAYGLKQSDLYRESNQAVFNDSTKSHPISQCIKTALPFTWSVRNLLIATGILLILWIPYVILSYPGIYWWDTSLQIAQFESSPRVLWDQHPFADSILFGLFAELGKLLWNNALMGLFTLIVFQCIAASFALSAIVLSMSHYSVGWPLRFISFALFAFFPAFPRMFTTLAKDTIFTPFFIFFIIMFFKLMSTQGEYIKRWTFIVPFLIVCVGMGLSKKTGALIVLGSLLLLAFSKYKLAIKTLCALVGITAFILCSFAIPIIAYSHLNITPGRPQESLALPIQQVANAATQQPDTFTASEKAILKDFYTVDLSTLEKNYSYLAADPVKDPVNTAQKTAFLKIWVKHMLINPQSYIGAFCGLTAGWFSFATPKSLVIPTNANINIPYNSAHHYEGIESIPEWSKDTLGANLMSYMDTVISQTPGINLLTSKAVWASILPMLCLFLALCRPRGKRWDTIIWLAPLALTIASLYVGPTSLYQEATRYVFPLMCTLPLWLAMCIAPKTYSLNS